MKRWLAILGLMACCSALRGQSQGNYTSQGRYELSKGRYAAAIELLNRSINQSSYNSEAFFLRGIAKYELEDLTGAEKDFSKAIELNPKNYEAFLYRGVCRSQVLNYKEAFTDFNQAIRLNEEDHRTYSNRALASLQMDRFVDVIADCNKVIDLKMADGYTYLVRGEAKSGLEMYNVAIEDFERSMKLDSLSMNPVLHRGMARAKLQQFEAAIVDFEQSMKLDTSSSLPVFHRGSAYAEMGKYKDAIADFNEVLRQYPDNAIVLFNRAITYSKMKQNGAAMSDYDRVIQLNPGNILGYYNRGNLRFDQKDLRGALQDYNKAIELFPEFLDAHEIRISAYMGLKDKAGFDRSSAELETVKRSMATSNEDTKDEQMVKLRKLTELKGDFETQPQEVGKIQHQKVDIRLLPFYRVSAFPETDRNIAVYDGFARPYYSTGVIALTTEKEQRTNEAKELLKTNVLRNPVDVKGLLRSTVLSASLGDLETSYARLDTCLSKDVSQVACYFTRATLLQSELEDRQLQFQKVVGSLDVLDPTYQEKTESLLARAEMDYRKVIELDKEMSFAYFNLAHLMVNAERYEEAETNFGSAAATAGNFIEANYNRGLIRILLGKISKGCEDLSLAGELGMTDSYNIIKRYCE